MALQLAFSDRYRLWAELVHAGAERVFVPTLETVRIGSEIPVEVVLPELTVSIVMMGRVVGLRLASDRFAAGAYLNFPSKELEKCRSFLGLPQATGKPEL